MGKICTLGDGQRYWEPDEVDTLLNKRLSDYENQYFEDFTFQRNSVLGEFITYQEQNTQGEWMDSSDNYEIGLLYSDYIFHVEELQEGIAGMVDSAEKIVSISPEYAEDKGVILHEMTHFYQRLLNEKPTYLRDILFYCLYNDLKTKVPDLDKRIFHHTHALRQQRISYEGGSHDLLFFLKSLDLDLRCEYKLGTVCGYGRDEFEQM